MDINKEYEFLLDVAGGNGFFTACPKEIIIHILEYAGDSVLNFATKYRKHENLIKIFRDTEFTEYLNKSNDIIIRNFSNNDLNPRYIPYTLHTNFATNIAVENVRYFEIIIGGITIEIIYVDTFDALYELYGIPRKNGNGNTIIPFYLSKIGVTFLEYFVIKIKLEYNNSVRDTNFHLETDQTPLSELEFTSPRLNVIFQCEDYRWRNWNNIRFPMIVLYILVNDPELEKLELLLDNERLCLYRDTVYGNQSVFKIIDINDFRNSSRYINFYKVEDFKILTDSSKSNGDIRQITTIHSQVLTVRDGCASLWISY